MNTSAIETIRYDGIHSAVAVEQHPNGVVVLRLSGIDIGEFGDLPMNAIAERIEKGGPVQLFIDARAVAGASIEVSGDWAQWLSRNRQHLRRIDMLTGSRFIEVTADFVRRFADLQGLMWIYTDAGSFDETVDKAIEQCPRS